MSKDEKNAKLRGRSSSVEVFRTSRFLINLNSVIKYQKLIFDYNISKAVVENIGATIQQYH